MSYNQIDEESPFVGDRPESRKDEPWWMKHRTYLFVGGYLFIAALTTIIVVSVESSDSSSKAPKNLIMMVPDGFGPASVTYGRLRSKELNREFVLDSIMVGTSRTYSSNSLVTDSAAGATAFSCGLKSYNYAIGVDPNGVPCPTILEAAQSKGMKVGLVVTSRITHATPAAFSSHVANRNSEEDIAEQQVAHKIDVMLGGGGMFYKANLRSDGKDMIQEAKDTYGAQFVDNAADMKKLEKTPVLGLFDDDHISYDIDRTAEQPSLLDMVDKVLKYPPRLCKGSATSISAIELLNKDNENGFFLLIEGSRIDHAGHGNDPVGHSSEIIMYDRTIEHVLNFAKNDGNTLMISVADHETGGFTLGRANENGTYAWYPEVISQVKHSTEWMSEEVLNNNADPVAVFEDNSGILLTEEEKVELVALSESVRAGNESIYVYQMWMAHKISIPAFLGWTTDLHTGVDVNIYSYGPGSEELRGNHENTDVGKVMEKYLGVNLSKITPLTGKKGSPSTLQTAEVPKNQANVLQPYHG